MQIQSINPVLSEGKQTFQVSALLDGVEVEKVNAYVSSLVRADGSVVTLTQAELNVYKDYQKTHNWSNDDFNYVCRERDDAKAVIYAASKDPANAGKLVADYVAAHPPSI